MGIEEETNRLSVLAQALLKLPAQELTRLGGENFAAELSNPILPDSPVAIRMQEIWDQRQEEFKQAVDKVADRSKLIEERRQLILGLDREGLTTEELLGTLENIDIHFEDIDNADDFMEGDEWSTLVGLLVRSSLDQTVRSKAAQVIATAIKHDPENQLKTIQQEVSLDVRDGGSTRQQTQSGITCLDLVLEKLLRGDETPEMSRSLLLILNTAVRGNALVRQHIADFVTADKSVSSELFSRLRQLASEDSIEMRRRLWTFISDLAQALPQYDDKLASLTADALCEVDWILQTARDLSAVTKEVKENRETKEETEQRRNYNPLALLRELKIVTSIQKAMCVLKSSS